MFIYLFRSNVDQAAIFYECALGGRKECDFFFESK